MKKEPDFEQLLTQYKSIVFAKEHLKKITLRIEQEQKRLKTLEDIVEKEYQDVRVLEKSSLRTIFKKTLDKNNLKYEKEKEEYLLSILQFRECQKIIELLNYEQKVLKEKINEEAVIHYKLNSLVTLQREEIIEKFPKKSELIFDIEDKLNSCFNFKNEFKISKDIAAKTLHLIEEMMLFLNNAKHNGNWGEDMKNKEQKMSLKNDYMDKAQDLSYQVKQLLQELQDILDQLNTSNYSFEIAKFDELKTFNDVYYDKLISDWIVHSKIVNSIDYLQTIQLNLEDLLLKLLAQFTFFDKKIKELKQQKTELLLTL